MYQWKTGKLLSAQGRERLEEIVGIILENRAIEVEQQESFLNPRSPNKIEPAVVGMDSQELVKAVQIIKETADQGKKVLIWGDYDADGIIGTALLWEALWQAGIDSLPYIPTRENGYGIQPDSLQPVLEKHSDIGLIITVDNGIVAQAGLQAAHSREIKTIVTDHHLRGEKSPPADAIVWSKEVCGAAVAWFLARQFYDEAQRNWDLLALATVTDMMPLLGVNRSLVRFGLEQLVKTDRLGLKTLLEQAGLSDKELSTYHLGYVMGPRLNAAGRLQDAMDSVRLLCTNKPQRARRLAQKLEKINRRRQKMTDQAVAAAKEKIDPQQSLLFAVLPEVHPGIVGLVAGKLLEEYYRPAVIVSCQDETFRASCRSPKDFNIITALRQFEDYLEEVGGHAQAAGFSIQEKYLSNFKAALLEYAEAQLANKERQPVLKADCQVNFTDLSYDLFRRLEQMAPFGLANPRPRFYTDKVLVRQARRVGRNNSHLKLILDDLGTPEEEAAVGKTNNGFDSIGFGLGERGAKIKAGDKIDIIYHLTVNNWQGRENLQLQIKGLRLSDEQ